MAEDLLFKIPYQDKKDAITKYLEILYKFHRLTDKEIQLLAELIYFYKELEQKYDADLASKLLFDTDTKKQIRANLNNMKDEVFQNYLSNLRKKKVIVNKKLQPAYIPPVVDFKLVMSFEKKKNG